MALSSLTKNPRSKIKTIRKLRMFQPSWGVGQPQQGLSGPAHGFILGLPSVHPKDGGTQWSSQSRASHLPSTAVTHPAVAPNTPQNMHALAVSYMCQ